MKISDIVGLISFVVAMLLPLLLYLADNLPMINNKQRKRGQKK